MRKELQELLAFRFPFMARNENGSKEERGYYDEYGIMADDGWFNLIFDLCDEITKIYEKNNLPVDIVVTGVKEKIGTLRFHVAFKNKSDSELVKKVHERIRNIVRIYEYRSYYVCEECGMTGEVRRNLNYVQSLCDDCYEEKLKELKKRDEEE